jgi:hypothetical protein
MNFNAAIMKLEYDYGKFTLSFRDPESEEVSEEDICI